MKKTIGVALFVLAAAVAAPPVNAGDDPAMHEDSIDTDQEESGRPAQAGDAPAGTDVIDRTRPDPYRPDAADGGDEPRGEPEREPDAPAPDAR